MLGSAVILRSGLLAAVLALAACKAPNAADAEANKDVAWLAADGTPESVAALGRLADTEPGAASALEARAATDVNVHIAAWLAVTRDAPWGTNLLRASLADPARAELAASAMPRRDPRLVDFVADLEGAVVRLAAGRRGSVVAGVLASVGPQAHVAVERRLGDAKTRSAMCDGIGLPEASADARGLLLAAGPETRDQQSCIDVVLGMVASEERALEWLGARAEPGLLNAAAKGALACARLASAWKRALAERPPAEHPALSVPLKNAIGRCNLALDPVLGEMLDAAPRARSVVVQAIEPFGVELGEMKETCRALASRYMAAENARIRERATDALANGCRHRR